VRIGRPTRSADCVD